MAAGITVAAMLRPMADVASLAVDVESADTSVEEYAAAAASP
jgi:hypothetical protein